MGLRAMRHRRPPVGRGAFSPTVLATSRERAARHETQEQPPCDVFMGSDVSPMSPDCFVTDVPDRTAHDHISFSMRRMYLFA